MSAMQSHATSNPNSIAQKAALEALVGSQDQVKYMCKAFDSRRVHMFERISKMPLISCIEPKGAFYVFIDLADAIGKKYKGEEIVDAAKFAEVILRDYAVAVIPCADFGFADHIRLSYAISMEQIDKGLDRLEEVLLALEA